MLEKSALFPKYMRILRDMQETVRENTYLLRGAFRAFPISLFNFCIDTWDNDYTFYGMKRDEHEEITFCTSSGHSEGLGTPLPLAKMAWDLAKKSEKYSVTPQWVKERFLEEIEKPVQRYESAKARVEQRACERLRKLEKGLRTSAF